MIATLTVRRGPAGARPRRRASPWPPTSPSGWCARACRSARRTRSPGALVALCDEPRPRALASSPTTSWPTVDARLTPDGARRCCRCRGALAARSAHGGTAPVRVAEQLARRCADGRARRTRRGPTGGALTLGLADRRDRPAHRPGRSRSRPRAARRVRASRQRPAGRSPSGSPRSRRTPGERRPRLARLPGPDAAQRGDVRPARPRLRLLHLRHALVRQPRLRPGGRGVGGPAAGRARSSTGDELARARRPAARARPATSPGARPG